MENNQISWFSTYWFSTERLGTFDWQNALWLYALILIPLIFLFRWLMRRFYNQKLPIALNKENIKNDALSFLRFIPPIIMATVIALVILALARPQTTDEQIEQWSEGIDIMMVIDISESMQIQDFQPNRLESAKEVARNFDMSITIMISMPSLHCSICSSVV